MERQSDAPVQVTFGDLQRLDACTDAQIAFAAMFPIGASYRQLLLALADHPKGLIWWEWLAIWVPALRTARDAYEAQCFLIADACGVQMDLIGEAYMAKRHSLIDEAQEAQLRQIYEAYEAQRCQIWEASDVRFRSALRSVAEMV